MHQTSLLVNTPQLHSYAKLGNGLEEHLEYNPGISNATLQNEKHDRIYVQPQIGILNLG